MKKGSIEPFFETYWRACLQNNSNLGETDKFFHITDAAEPELTREKLQYIASQRLSRDTKEEPKLIPAFKAPNGNKINVIFIGDVTDEKTIERFHLWAAYLMKQKMPGTGTDWATISKVSMYGILIRPDSATIDDNVMTPRVKGFLNELATLEQMDINHRPFEHILFLQSSENTVKRAAAEKSLCLAAYHIARTDGQCFDQNSSYCFHDANATGVFYEADVQNELDTYNLSQVMLSNFIANEGPDFFNTAEAERFVGDNSDFVDSLTPKKLSKSLTSGCKSPDTVRIKRPVHPLNILKIGKVWREYYGNYIVNMKRDLVNKMRRNLIMFEDDYKKQLAQQQVDFIGERTDTLQELVFQMFCDTGSRDRFRHISLPQSLKVLELFEARIGDGFKDDSGKAKAFIIPDDLLKAARKANENKWTSDHVLDVLTSKLQRLPLYNLARLLRVILLGVMVGGTLAAMVNPLYWILTPLILAIDLLIFNSKVKRIEALKDQYTGMKLVEMRDLMGKQVDLMIEKTKDEMGQYIQWLRENKLQRLQSSLSVMRPPSFQFTESEVFQPLVNRQSASVDDTKLLIPAKGSEVNKLADTLTESGSFGKNPLTKNVPTAQITAENGNTYRIFDLIKGHDATVQYLVQNLMREHRNVIDGTEQKVDFTKHQTGSRSMLLLLDISSSMCGKPIEDLKNYVNALSSKGSIEWIAFSHQVCLTSREADIEKAEAKGGTNYIPAIKLAVDWLGKGSQYDDIIIISDGSPFETPEDIIAEAKNLNQPLNTISIGGNAETVLVDIAMQTGGEEVTIDNFDDLPEKWENEILPRIAAVEDGLYSFGDLLKRCQIIPAARALHSFTLQQLKSGNLKLPQLIVQYGCPEGLTEWYELSGQRNTIKQGVSGHKEKISCSTASSKFDDELKQKLNSIKSTSLDLSSDEPGMIASLLTTQPLDKIGDLQWAQTLNSDDKSINDENRLNEVLTDSTSIINVYKSEIGTK